MKLDFSKKNGDNNGDLKNVFGAKKMGASLDLSNKMGSVDDFKNKGSIKANLEGEMTETYKKAKEYKEKINEYFDIALDNQCYFSLVFKNKEERDAFVREKGLKLRSDVVVIYDENKGKL